jgi:hypothetical protein
MLASTVQFSSNDQPPTTPTRRLSSLGPASRRSEQHVRTLRYPTARPAHLACRPVPRRSSTGDNQPDVPNSQRSTHEQPAPDTRRCTGL